MNYCLEVTLCCGISEDYFCESLSVNVAVGQNLFAKTCHDFVETLTASFNCNPSKLVGIDNIYSELTKELSDC